MAVPAVQRAAPRTGEDARRLTRIASSAADSIPSSAR